MSITIKGLSHYYPNGKKALNDINLEIPSGMFGLLGPNGAGKSTLMRILVTLMEPTEGEIDVCGYDIRTQRQEVRRILGYLPQDFRFFAKYKVREFLEYAAALSGMTNSVDRGKAVDAMLEQVGLYEARDWRRCVSTQIAGLQRLPPISTPSRHAGRHRLLGSRIHMRSARRRAGTGRSPRSRRESGRCWPRWCSAL